MLIAYIKLFALRIRSTKISIMKNFEIILNLGEHKAILIETEQVNHLEVIVETL